MKKDWLDRQVLNMIMWSQSAKYTLIVERSLRDFLTFLKEKIQEVEDSGIDLSIFRSSMYIIIKSKDDLRPGFSGNLHALRSWLTFQGGIGPVMTLDSARRTLVLFEAYEQQTIYNQFLGKVICFKIFLLILIKQESSVFEGLILRNITGYLFGEGVVTVRQGDPDILRSEYNSPKTLRAFHSPII